MVRSANIRLSSTRLSFETPTTIASSCGIAPPAREVPAPRATTFTPFSLQKRITAATSCRGREGSTTAMGSRANRRWSGVGLEGAALVLVNDQRDRAADQSGRSPPRIASRRAPGFGGVGAVGKGDRSSAACPPQQGLLSLDLPGLSSGTGLRPHHRPKVSALNRGTAACVRLFPLEQTNRGRHGPSWGISTSSARNRRGKRSMSAGGARAGAVPRPGGLEAHAAPGGAAGACGFSSARPGSSR